MNERKKVVMEYSFSCSMRFLYPYLSTPEGLACWFAEKVKAAQAHYTFFWDGDATLATLVETKMAKSVIFKFDDNAPEEYLEFSMKEAEVAQDTILLITDFADADELEGINMVWDSAITRLRSVIGA